MSGNVVVVDVVVLKGIKVSLCDGEEEERKDRKGRGDLIAGQDKQATAVYESRE